MKKEKFNFKKALNGHPLITRDGRLATNFRTQKSVRNRNYPFEAEIEGLTYTFSKNGEFFRENSKEDLDLFLLVKQEQPEPKEGDFVWVKDFEDERWEKRIFLYKTSFGKYVCAFNIGENESLESALSQGKQVYSWDMLKTKDPKEEEEKEAWNWWESLSNKVQDYLISKYIEKSTIMTKNIVTIYKKENYEKEF